MHSYKNLFKTKLLKNKGIKTSFIIDDKKNNFPLYRNNFKKRENSIRIKNINSSTFNKKKSEEMNYLESHNNNNDSEDQFISENYEDLFLYFLLETEKIDFFERKIRFQKENNNLNNKNIKYFFNYIFQSFTSDNKLRWKNFLFPEPVYKLLYIKSRKLQKEIIKFSIMTNKKIIDIMSSYNKKYKIKMNIKNWCLKPKDAYKNYEDLYLKEKVEKDNLNNSANPYSKSTNLTDFVIKTDNNGRGKTLICLGKAFNIYIDDYDTHKDNNGISMAVEESKYYKNTRKEIIYTLDDINLKKINKYNTINGKFETNGTKNKIFYKSKSNNKYKIKNLKNIKLKNKSLKTFLNLDKKDKNKESIFNKKLKLDSNNIVSNYNKNKDKLPSLIKLTKTNGSERNLSQEHFYNNNNNYPIFNDYNKNKIKYNNFFLFDKKIKKNKKNINSFRIFEGEKILQNKKFRIINFFSKQKSDFYY